MTYYLDSTDQEIRKDLILQDSKAYVRLLEPHHIERLLRNLGRTAGLTEAEQEEASRDADSTAPDWLFHVTRNTTVYETRQNPT